MEDKQVLSYKSLKNGGDFKTKEAERFIAYEDYMLAYESGKLKYIIYDNDGDLVFLDLPTSVEVLERISIMKKLNIA